MDPLLISQTMPNCAMPLLPVDPFFLPTHVRVTLVLERMPLKLRGSKTTSLAAARVALRAIRDSSDGFPPLKSVVSAIMIIWEMSEVSFLLLLTLLHMDNHFLILEGQIKQEELQAASPSGNGDRERYLAANKGLWG